ncbi:hypothetical protein BH18THE2_BH18THE2_35360 [soil metagenome]
MTVTAGSNKKKKLTRVLSTKLSIEDYERFQKCTNFALEEPSRKKKKHCEFTSRLLVITTPNPY